MQFWDWVIVAAYFAVSLAIGLYYTRRASKSMNEFFISGRAIPWWLAGTSMVATSFSSDTPLFVTGLVRSKGIYENWMWWCFAISGMLAVFVFSRWWRRTEVMTDVELAELRYGGKSAKILRVANGVMQSLIVNVSIMAWVIVGTVKIVTVTVDIEPWIAFGVTLAVALGYSMMSGLWGALVTDLFQFVLAMAGAIILAVIAVDMAGGLSALHEKILAMPGGADKLAFFPTPDGSHGILSYQFLDSAFMAFLVYIFVLWWTKNADGNAAVIQRINSSKNEKHAIGATLYFQIANNALRPWPWIMAALASLVIIQNAPLMPNGKPDHESVYPLMMVMCLPAGLLGLMVASLLAAFMSTITTHLNLSAAYLTSDIYRRFIAKDKSEKHYVLVSRLMVFAAMVLAAAFAACNDSIAQIFKMLLALIAGIGPVLLARWFWWRINAWSEISAMMTSFAANAVIFIMNKSCEGAGYNGIPYPAVIITVVAVSSVVWLTVTLLTNPVPMERLSVFYRRVRPFGFWGPVAAANSDVKPGEGWGNAVVSWVAGFVMVFSLTFAIGKFLLLETNEGLIYCVVFAVSLCVVLWGILKRKTA
jgi:Na+/proline symporter